MTIKKIAALPSESVPYPPGLPELEEIHLPVVPNTSSFSMLIETPILPPTAEGVLVYYSIATNRWYLL